MIASFAFGAVLVSVGPALASRPGDPPRRAALVAALLPPLVGLALVASLALHMHVSLDNWPGSLETRGFPRELLLHAEIAYFAFGSLFIACLFVWPVALLLCLAAPRLQPGLPYLGAFAAACLAALLVMQLLPDPFLYWWWD